MTNRGVTGAGALELVVFDLAGTTADVADPVPAAFTAALGEAGIEVSDRAIEAVRGRSKRDAISELVAGRRSDTDAIYRRFQALVLAGIARNGVRPVAGAADAFVWLREHGVRTALTTGFGRDVAEHVVALLEWGDAVDAIVTNDDVPRGRPAPYLIFRAMERTGVERVDRVVAVGDTSADLEAARNAGAALAIGVLSGAHDGVRLAACSHDAILESVADLPVYLEQFVRSSRDGASPPAGNE